MSFNRTFEKNNFMKTYICFLFVCLAIFSCRNNNSNLDNARTPSTAVDWSYADSIKIEIMEAVIPTDTFYIADLVKTNSPKQIQEAINIVSEKGGGTLILSNGIYNSGAIELKSKVELFLEQEAIIIFIPDQDLYPLKYTWFNGRPCMNFSSMIYARNQSDIKISGKGIIDGQGNNPVWKNMKYNEKADNGLLKELNDKKIKVANRKFGKGHSLRPDLIAFYECSRINIEGVTITNTPYFAIHPVMSNHLSIKNGLIKSKGYNQVGIAIESSQNILVDSMQIEDIEEGIKILSGSSNISNNKPSSSIVIQNSRFNNITYTPIIFSSKSNKGINRVFLSDLQFKSTEAGICIYGQQDVQLNDIFIKKIHAEKIQGAFLYARILRTKESSPIIFDVQIDSIQVKECGRAFVIIGNSKSPIQNISIQNSGFTVSKGAFAKYLTSFNLENIEINGETITNTYNIGDNEIPKIYFDNPEDEVLDSDDIQYSDLPIAVKEALNKNYTNVPVNDIDRIITSSNVIYDIDLELESFQNIEIMLQADGEIIRTELESNFARIPEKVIIALEKYLETKPLPYLFNEIKEIQYKDFTYYEIKGEYNRKLFALGISKEGKVIEEKQKSITSYFIF